MAKKMRNQRMVTNPPKRVANQQDSYEKVKPKPTGPGIVSAKVSPRKDPSPSDARRHADGKNHKNPKARPVTSKLSNEPKVPDKAVPSRVKFAKGVPNTAAMRKGYYPPGKRLGSGNISDNTDYNSPATYSEQVHNDY